MGEIPPKHRDPDAPSGATACGVYPIPILQRIVSVESLTVPTAFGIQVAPRALDRSGTAND